MTVSILGTYYRIDRVGYDSYSLFKDESNIGSCEYYDKRIVICDLATHPTFSSESESSRLSMEKETLRHEIVHAFLYESGLAGSSLGIENGWATNEEMVDWIAIQANKLIEAWKAAGCLD